MASTNFIERVASALEKNDDGLLRQIYRDLSTKIQSYAVLTNRELDAQIGKTLLRNLDAEAYIPKYAKRFQGATAHTFCAFALFNCVTERANGKLSDRLEMHIPLSMTCR